MLHAKPPRKRWTGPEGNQDKQKGCEESPSRGPRPKRDRHRRPTPSHPNANPLHESPQGAHKATLVRRPTKTLPTKRSQKYRKPKGSALAQCKLATQDVSQCCPLGHNWRTPNTHQKKTAGTAATCWIFPSRQGEVPSSSTGLPHRPCKAAERRGRASGFSDTGLLQTSDHADGP